MAVRWVAQGFVVGRICGKVDGFESEVRKKSRSNGRAVTAMMVKDMSRHS